MEIPSNEELLLTQEALILRVQQLERENAQLKIGSSEKAETRERQGSMVEQMASGVYQAGVAILDGATAVYDGATAGFAAQVGIEPDSSGFWFKDPSKNDAEWIQALRALAEDEGETWRAMELSSEENAEGIRAFHSGGEDRRILLKSKVTALLSSCQSPDSQG